MIVVSMSGIELSSRKLSGEKRGAPAMSGPVGAVASWWRWPPRATRDPRPPAEPGKTVRRALRLLRELAEAGIATPEQARLDVIIAQRELERDGMLSPQTA